MSHLLDELDELDDSSAVPRCPVRGATRRRAALEGAASTYRSRPPSRPPGRPPGRPPNRPPSTTGDCPSWSGSTAAGSRRARARTSSPTGFLSAPRWLHANVRGFGGDPSRITVAGESAGGSFVRGGAPRAVGLPDMPTENRTSGTALPAPHFRHRALAEDRVRRGEQPRREGRIRARVRPLGRRRHGVTSGVGCPACAARARAGRLARAHEIYVRRRNRLWTSSSG
ncbi:carboxylesterase family protein [Streptomyces sp. NPDC021093]|uniref:carboxylesterase family protein n=1 Tax=Streptomyces sp. NPDC021093 TaxID=3365112 RepID=UPI0037B15D5A